MAAQTALVLNTKSYAPRGNSGDVSSWVLAGDLTFGGAKSTASLSLREAPKAGTTRVHFKLVVPKAASDDSPCGCAGTVLATSNVDIVVTVPTGFSLAERADLSARVQSLVASTVFSKAVTDLEGVW